jgi:predicted dehydrogenase
MTLNLRDESLTSMINIGLIGMGHWGPNHFRVFNSLPDARVSAIADTDPARLQRFAAGSGLRAYPTAEALLADPRLNAVVISTPTSTHFSLVKAALLAGLHVLCEKPLCLSSREADELARLSQERRRVLMVGHVFLFNAGLMKIKQLLDAGELGQPRYLAAVRTNLGPFRRDVNAGWDLASHDIAVFNWLLGSEPESVSAMGAGFLQPGIEDVVNITLKYPGNVMATVLASWLDPKKVRQLTLVGSARMVTWDDMNLTSPVAIYEKGAKIEPEAASYGDFLRISMWEGDVRLPKIPPGEPLRVQDEYFLRAIADPSLNRSGASFAAGVVRALERAANCLVDQIRMPGDSRS